MGCKNNLIFLKRHLCYCQIPKNVNSALEIFALCIYILNHFLCNGQWSEANKLFAKLLYEVISWPANMILSKPFTVYI